MEEYENFLIERRKLLRARIQHVFLVNGVTEATRQLDAERRPHFAAFSRGSIIFSASRKCGLSASGDAWFRE
jgi:hypothetical protein